MGSWDILEFPKFSTFHRIPLARHSLPPLQDCQPYMNDLHKMGHPGSFHPMAAFLFTFFLKEKVFMT